MKMAKRKFQIGQEVRLPGTQIKTTGYGYANKYLWNETGTVEALGLSKPLLQRVKVGKREERRGDLICFVYDYKTKEVRVPMVKVNGRWYPEKQVKKA